MNSLILVLVSGAVFFWGYRFYASKLAQLWQLDPKRATPAYTKYDSLDYIPAKNWLVLFGHHFSSIAGAGPIIGPVIAVMIWGWLPALLWVVIGSVFIGGVHDFGSLIVSVRGGGSSIADIAMHVISRRAKILFSLFVWLALILVIAVFIFLCADTFVKEPKIVLPSLGLVPVAMLIGYLLYYRRVNSVLSTLLGLLCLAALMLAGNFLPITANIAIWLCLLLIYCFFASILPVNILLQPRDYLSSFLLFFGVGAGFLGIILNRPILTFPAYRGFSASEGYLWPALFITVACGATSGFHALISSGTTSKQIASERHIKRIGFGAMLAEAMVALLAIIVVSVLLVSGDNTQDLLKTSGPIAIFGRGYGQVTNNILSGNGQFIAITILNAFILTTLDTATRITRYLTEELFGLKNRFISTGIVVILGGALAFSGKWNKIWPAFGASNQLVAALALFVLSCWLLSKGKSAKFTIWPAFFMFITTLVALLIQGINYFLHKDVVLLVITLLLIFLSGLMLFEVAPVIFARRKHA